MARKTVPQNYPRDDHGLLREAALTPHSRKISTEELREIILDAIQSANKKASRQILNVPDGLSKAEVADRYKQSGKDLFRYFIRYCGDPAATAHQCHGRHYAEVAEEQFRNRTLQKERMNSGWRYQYIAKDAAIRSARFHSVSDIGTQEADFYVSVGFREKAGHLTIYVSVKNRTNTMGGQDWPKAIAAMEDVAVADKNRTGPYLCVFGIAMEKGGQSVKRNARTKQAYSVNTEVWRSDFFWPFFTNCSYEEIVTAVLDILIETHKTEFTDTFIPEELKEAFGECCREADLLDECGRFNDPYKLVRLFCGVSK